LLLEQQCRQPQEQPLVQQPLPLVHHLVEGTKMRNFFNDIIGQVWTLLGMFVAWIVLEGTAKEVVGWGIIAAAIVWVVTFPLRNKDD
jgi:hypothetical protein